MNASVLALFDRIRPNNAHNDCAIAERIILKQIRNPAKRDAVIRRAQKEIRRGSPVSLAVHRAMKAR